MSSIGLAAFAIRIRNRRNRQSCDLDSFTPGIDFIDVLTRYLTNDQARHRKLSGLLKVFKFENLDASGRIVKGIVKTGEYGYESDLIDAQTGLDTHHRTSDEAELLPFYFLALIPSGSDEGILLLQRFKQFGITSIFREIVQRQFNKAFKNHSIEINPLVPDQVLNRIIDESRIVKARFIKFRLPTDTAERLAAGHREDQFEVEYTIKAKQKNHVPLTERIKASMRNETDSNILELENFEYDNVKIEVEVGDKLRTIDLSDLSRVSPNFDITEQVIIGPNGHPTFQSIDQQASQLVGSLREAIGV